MMLPFLRANATSSSSCAFVAAAPVGLFGEQKKITSVAFVLARSGKKPFSGLHGMYSMPLNCDVSESYVPVMAIITLAQYISDCIRNLSGHRLRREAFSNLDYH